MDFHRRSSLSAYCVALAYRPLHEVCTVHSGLIGQTIRQESF